MDKEYAENMVAFLDALESGSNVSEARQNTPYAERILRELTDGRYLIGTSDGYIINSDLTAIRRSYQAQLDEINRAEADRKKKSRLKLIEIIIGAIAAGAAVCGILSQCR